MTRGTRMLTTAIVVCLATRPGLSQQVRIHSGVIAGVTEGDVTAYKGVPYAAAPVGQLRWRPPQPAPRWDGVRDASAFGPACVQPPFAPSTWAKGWSEDCLTINIWTPAKTPARPMPVLFVIPGGGFFAGGGADPRTDARELVRQGIVVVTFNYRLGVFGFFAHPTLSKESPTHTSGNYGLMDQIAALRWVHDNIASFGGDPRNVTIDGCSVGGSSVLYFMISPLARGLFARGIAESAALVYAPIAHLKESHYGFEAAEAAGLRFGADIAALRSLSAEELLARSKTRTDIMYTDGIDYWPIVDGVVLPDEPAKLLDAGKFSHTPLIIGTTVDEATVFASALPIKTASAWRAHIAARDIRAPSRQPWLRMRRRTTPMSVRRPSAGSMTGTSTARPEQRRVRSRFVEFPCFSTRSAECRPLSRCVPVPVPSTPPKWSTCSRTRCRPGENRNSSRRWIAR